MPPELDRSPPLAPERAFVVQFHSDTEIESSRASGRVEHIVSGQVSVFPSLQVLLAFMDRVLREVRTTSLQDAQQAMRAKPCLTVRSFRQLCFKMPTAMTTGQPVKMPHENGVRERDNRMTCTIQNLTRRMVSIRGNSGATWHLPPKVALDLMDAEVMENAKIAKLVASGVTAVQHEETPVPHEESVESGSRAQERGRRSRAQREENE